MRRTPRKPPPEGRRRARDPTATRRARGAAGPRPVRPRPAPGL